MKTISNKTTSLTRLAAIGALALSFLFLGQASAIAQNAGGGFAGPGPELVSVEQAKSMKDDTPVTLRGNIVQSLGDEDYLFKDQSGTIMVEIDTKVWMGLRVEAADLVEIRGEVDKDWNKVKIDAWSISKVE